MDLKTLGRAKALFKPVALECKSDFEIKCTLMDVSDLVKNLQNVPQRSGIPSGFGFFLLFIKGLMMFFRLEQVMDSKNVQCPPPPYNIRNIQFN